MNNQVKKLYQKESPSVANAVIDRTSEVAQLKEEVNSAFREKQALERELEQLKVKNQRLMRENQILKNRMK